MSIDRQPSSSVSGDDTRGSVLLVESRSVRFPCFGASYSYPSPTPGPKLAAVDMLPACVEASVSATGVSQTCELYRRVTGVSVHQTNTSSAIPRLAIRSNGSHQIQNVALLSWLCSQRGRSSTSFDWATPVSFDDLPNATCDEKSRTDKCPCCACPSPEEDAHYSY